MTRSANRDLSRSRSDRVLDAGGNAMFRAAWDRDDCYALKGRQRADAVFHHSSETLDFRLTVSGSAKGVAKLIR